MAKKEEKEQAPPNKRVVKKGRKPWKVDLKWLCGILAAMLLTASLFSLAFYRVATNPQVEKLSKAGTVKGMPGQPDFKIKIKGEWYNQQQLEKLPEEDLQMDEIMTQAVMQPVADSIGATEGAALTLFLITFIPALLFLILTIFFSYRWGHLLSFAVVLFISASPVFLGASILKVFGSAAAAGPKVGNGDPLSGMIFSFVNIFADSNFALFSGLLIFAVLLMSLAGLGGIISMAIKPKVAPQPASPTAPKTA